MIKKKTNTKKVIIIVSVLLLIGLILSSLVVYGIYQKNKSNSGQKATQETSIQAADIQSADTESKDEAVSTQNQASTQPTINAPAPNKPTLIKSSGNNGPVPINIVIEFICQGDPGLNCNIVLVNQNGSVINLQNQPLKNNGRDQYLARWEWKSLSGVWQVYSVVTNSQGKSAQSDKQTLEVK